MVYKRKTIIKIPFWGAASWMLIATVIMYSIKGEYLLSSINFIALTLAFGFEKLFKHLGIEHNLIKLEKTIKEEN